jgi:hypothetical protein
MNQDFFVGQKVVCVDSADLWTTYLTAGKVYTISYIGRRTVQVEGVKNGYYKERFKPVEVKNPDLRKFL